MPEGSVVHPIIVTFPPGLAHVGGRELREKAGLLAERLGKGPKLVKRNSVGTTVMFSS